MALSPEMYTLLSSMRTSGQPLLRNPNQPQQPQIPQAPPQQPYVPGANNNGGGYTMYGPQGQGGSSGTQGIPNGTLNILGQSPQDKAKNMGKLTGAASMASTGMSMGGPWGALAGAIAGYAMNGGAKDFNPISSLNMSTNDAIENGNYVRLGANPAASVAGFLGQGSDSLLGKALDPIGSVFGKNTSGAEKAWDKFKGVDPATPGRALDLTSFEESYKGMWDTNKKTLDPLVKALGVPDREGYKGWLNQTLASAIQGGQVKQGMSSEDIYNTVIKPKMDTALGGKGTSTWSPAMSGLFADLTDRALTGDPIDRATLKYPGKGYTAYPSLADLLKPQNSPQPVMGNTMYNGLMAGAQ